MKKICVFCGSSKPENHTDLENEVISLGNLILKKKLQLVYGGAKIGLMGLVANTILKGGGYVTGIIPKLLSKKEILNKEVSDLIKEITLRLGCVISGYLFFRNNGHCF